MELALVLFITFFILFASWDLQVVPIRIIDRVEHKDTFVVTVSMFKWPILFKRNVYFIKSTQNWVIPSKKSAFEPVLHYYDLQEAYLIWKYENDVD